MPDRGRKGRTTDRPAPAKLSIGTLGTFAAYADGREVRIGNRKSRALVAYLALSDAGEQTRERLVGILWSETEEAKARASLRQALYEIREAFSAAGFDGLKSDKLSVALERSAISVDLADVLDRARDGQVHALLLERQRLLDTLLEEFETIDPAFRVWLLAKRQSFHDRIVRLLETVLRGLSTQHSGQRELAQALLNLDPTHEEAARTLIRAHVADGDVGAALRVYKVLWDLLEEEYDVEPSKETQELIAAVKMGPSPATSGSIVPVESAPRLQPYALITVIPPAAGTDKLVDRRGTRIVVSIAPFEAVAAPPQQHYLVQGFRRELIACLVRFREWLVRDQAVGSSFEPQGNAPDEYALEASAYMTDDAIRLILTLRECATNMYLWSERHQITPANWHNAQQAVVQRIATALNVHVSAGRMALIAPKSDVDLQAYDLWLRGQAHFLTYEPLGWQKATDIFRDIIARNPEFAPAYSSLAQLQNTTHFVHPGVFREVRRAEAALTYAQEAIRLDPMDSRGQLCLGWAYAMSGRHNEADIHHQLAHELNENDPWTLVSSALGSAFRGDSKQALELADHALNLSLTPSPAHWRYQAIIRYLCEQYDRSIQAAEQAEMSIASVFVWKASALHHLGHVETAQAAAERFFKSVQASWFGKEPATRENMTRWFLHGFPMKSRENWERLRHDFAGAGAPTGKLEYGRW